MDELIQNNKSKLNYTSCYFYNKENPYQAKLKLWGKKYFDYLQNFKIKYSLKYFILKMFDPSPSIFFQNTKSKIILQ